MTTDLFGEQPPAHDPGGKVRMPLLPGMTGKAVMSECGFYRHALTRWWNHLNPRFALWIGMNPSTADANVDDPTVRRDILYTRDVLGLGGLVKCNVMNYRATNPKALLAPGVDPCSPMNLPGIIAEAGNAAVVIMAHGALPKRLRRYADDVADALDRAGIEMLCLGTTADGSPRHPSRLKRGTPLERYRRAS
jgi:hypothetical protein